MEKENVRIIATVPKSVRENAKKKSRRTRAEYVCSDSYDID